MSAFRNLTAALVSLAFVGCAASGPGEPDHSNFAVQRAPRIASAEHHDSSPPLYLIEIPHQQVGNIEHEVKPIPRHYSHAAPAHDPVRQSAHVSLLAPTLSLNFDGVGNGFTGPQGTFTVNAAPPDTNGDVGPNHYVQIVNTDFAVFNKSGTALYGPVPVNTLWNTFGGGCQTNNDGDPVVIYDPIADRWVISQFSVSTTPYLQCVAVSTSSDPTGSYYRYSFTYPDFPDYPKMGVWPDAYYETFNFFAGGSTFAGAEVCAYDRSSMLTGATATQQCFNTGTNFGGVLPSDLDGANLPPAGSPNYIVGLGASSGLAFWQFHVDWTTPANTTFTGPTSLATAAYSEACNGGTCIPQTGTNEKLDSLADRVMYRLAYRNFGDHEALVVNHSITAGSSTGVRWYELRPDASHNLSIFQQGTYAPDANYRWMGSAAMDQAGNIALGFSVSSSATHPGIHYTGRLASDAPGTMTQGEGSLIDGPGSQLTNLNRWGDYSQIAVDPSDDCTFWITNEYIPSNGTFNWKTRIGSFKLPGCPAVPAGDFSISSSPSTVSVVEGGGSGTSAISTAVTTGVAGTVNLAVTGAPAGMTASLSPTSVTAGNGSTLSVSASCALAAGTYPLTVTGTEGSNTHSTTVSVTVAAAALDFSMAANPASLTIGQGNNGTSAISTSAATTCGGTVSLSASASDPGLTASLSPTSVSTGGGSTLTISASATIAPGSYSVTVTGTEGTATHTATVGVTVTTPPDFSISASPASLGLTPGGGSGASTISTAAVSGTGTVSLSVSGSPAGLTASLSPTSVTAGGSSTLTVSADCSTAAGNYTLTVTGAEGSATHTATVAVTVAAAPLDFSVSASPASLSIAQGSSGNSTISTGIVGCGGSVGLSAAVSPAGPTASLNPTSVNAGGHSTLTVTVGTGVAAGAYTVTVTGTEGTATHTATVNVTVTVATGVIVNGGFETGDFTGWTTSGVTAISTTAHTGSFSAMVGSANAFLGDSSIKQTFTAPAGTGHTLSFWYQVVCTDTVRYDWATATLKDNTTNKTTTVLSKTCTNNGAWVSKSVNLTGGHSYTLTLVDHDDGYANPPDPTYTLYDDVAVK